MANKLIELAEADARNAELADLTGAEYAELLGPEWYEDEDDFYAGQEEIDEVDWQAEIVEEEDL